MRTYITEVQSKIIQVVLISFILTIFICWRVLVFWKPRSEHICWNWMIFSLQKLWISWNQPKKIFKRFKIVNKCCVLLINDFCPYLTFFLELNQTLQSFKPSLSSQVVVMGRTPFYRTLFELKHHFSHIERTRTCSSIGDQTQTPYFLLWTNENLTLNLIGFSQYLLQFYRGDSNIIFWTSNKLEHFHLLVIELQHPNFGFEWINFEHRSTHHYQVVQTIASIFFCNSFVETIFTTSLPSLTSRYFFTIFRFQNARELYPRKSWSFGWPCWGNSYCFRRLDLISSTFDLNYSYTFSPTT